MILCGIICILYVFYSIYKVGYYNGQADAYIEIEKNTEIEK